MLSWGTPEILQGGRLPEVKGYKVVGSKAGLTFNCSAEVM